MPYWATLVTTFKFKQVYRTDVILKMLGSMILIIATREAWLAIYTSGSGLTKTTGVSVDSMVTYAMLSCMLILLYGDTLTYEISARVSTGNIVLDLQKPINFQFYHLSRDIAQTLSSLLYISLPISIISMMLFPFNLPSPKQGIAFIISLMLAVVITFAINFLASLPIYGNLGVLLYERYPCSDLFWFFHPPLVFSGTPRGASNVSAV